MAASLPIDLHHFEGAVVGYFMAYCWNVAIKLEFSENYGATVNVNVGFQPHLSSYCFFCPHKKDLLFLKRSLYLNMWIFFFDPSPRLLI